MFNADQNSVSEETGALADQAFERVRELFRTKGLRAGQFVSVHELTRMIDLPLAPTREAVKRAEALGFVTIVPKRGVLIMEATAKNIRECLDMRCIFDQEGARRMIGDLDEKLFEQIRATHVAMVQEAQHSMTIEVQQRAMKIDWQFHMTLSTGLKNPLAESAYALNHERLLIFHHTRPLLPDRIVPAFTEHLGIMDAMEKGDAESVYEAVTFHYQNIRRWWSFID